MKKWRKTNNFRIVFSETGITVEQMREVIYWFYIRRVWEQHKYKGEPLLFNSAHEADCYIYRKIHN